MQGLMKLSTQGSLWSADVVLLGMHCQNVIELLCGTKATIGESSKR